MRVLVEAIPVLLVLYGAFLLGQVSAKRKIRDRRNPEKIIAAARMVAVERVVRGDGTISQGTATVIQLALDEWDSTPT